MGSSCCTMVVWNPSPSQAVGDGRRGEPEEAQQQQQHRAQQQEEQQHPSHHSVPTSRRSRNALRSGSGSSGRRASPHDTPGFTVLVPVARPCTTTLPSSRPAVTTTTVPNAAAPNPFNTRLATHTPRVAHQQHQQQQQHHPTGSQSSCASLPSLQPPPPPPHDAATTNAADGPLVQLEAMPSPLVRSPAQSESEMRGVFPSGSTLRRMGNGDALPSSQRSLSAHNTSASNLSAKLSDGSGALPLEAFFDAAPAAASTAAEVGVRRLSQHPLPPSGAADDAAAAAEATTMTTHVVSVANFPLEVQQQLQQDMQRAASLESASLPGGGGMVSHHPSWSPMHSGNNSSATIVRDPPLFNTHDHSWATTTTRSGTGTVFVLADSLRAELFGSRSFDAAAGGSNVSAVAAGLRWSSDSSSPPVHA